MKHDHLQRMASSSHATYLQRSDFHGWVIDFTKPWAHPRKETLACIQSRAMKVMKRLENYLPQERSQELGLRSKER